MKHLAQVSVILLLGCVGCGVSRIGPSGSDASAEASRGLYRPQSLSRLVTKLEKQAGKRLAVSPELSRTIVAIDAKDAPMETILERLADATLATWIEKEGVMVLEPSPELRAAKGQEIRDARVGHFRSFLTKYDPKKNPQPSPEEVAPLLEASSDGSVPGLDDPAARMKFNWSQPMFRAHTALLQALGPEELANVFPGEMTTWSSAPVEGQRPLGTDQFVQSLSGAYSLDLQSDQPFVVSLMFRDSADDLSMVLSGPGIPQEPVRMFFPEAHGSSIRSKVTPSPEQDAIRKARNGKQQDLHNKEVFEILADLEKNEPIDLLGSSQIFSESESQEPKIWILPDYVLANPGNPLPPLTIRLAEMLKDPRYFHLEQKDGWRITRPVEPITNDLWFDRAAASALVREAFGGESTNHQAAARLIASTPPLMHELVERIEPVSAAHSSRTTLRRSLWIGLLGAMEPDLVAGLTPDPVKLSAEEWSPELRTQLAREFRDYLAAVSHSGGQNWQSLHPKRVHSRDDVLLTLEDFTREMLAPGASIWISRDEKPAVGVFSGSEFSVQHPEQLKTTPGSSPQSPNEAFGASVALDVYRIDFRTASGARRTTEFTLVRRLPGQSLKPVAFAQGSNQTKLQIGSPHLQKPD